MTSTNEMSVGIIGAGIGGLVAAHGLQLHGARVVVFERAAQPPASGSALSVFANGWRALDSVGVGDRIRGVAGSQVQGLQAGQRRPDGTWLATTSEDAIRGLRLVHRADLQEELLASLAPGTVHFGAEVTAIDAETATVALRGRAAPVHFDLVIAADGINSRARAAWDGNPGTRYSGYSAWRGITRTPVDPLGAAGETWGKGRRFGYAPLRDGRIYWFAVASMPADSPATDEHGAVARLVEGWHDPIPAIVAATEPAAVFRLPIRDLAGEVPTFHRGRCVLLGDAAHAMTPDLGQGGNQAMEDAATLTALVADLCRSAGAEPARLQAALTEYDRLRRRRTQPIARRARGVGRLAQAHGPVAVPLRNALMRMTPQKTLDRQLVALQDWQPPPGAVRRPLPAH
jgi:2-polyprenyl-6-methoxyphenol hydroxylase-like FAD-dependent oxidoreductase